MRRWLVKCALGFVLCFDVVIGYGQAPAQPITPADTKPTFTPREFYVAGVFDGRKDRTNSATLLQAGAKGAASVAIKTEIKDGAVNALRQFIQHNLPVNTSSHPIIIRINEFSISETPGAAGYAQGEIKLGFTFMLKRRFDTVKLVNYAGGVAYSRPVSQPNMIGPTLGTALMGSLDWFNAWINKNADSNILLAKSVSVTFSDYTEKGEGDTIYYDVKRPLTWNDFKAKQTNPHFDASVMPGFGYSENVKVSKGIIHVNFTIKTYLPKSASWADEERVGTYALNHEQRHFDIVKIVTERYKRKMKDEHYTVEDYDGPVASGYFEFFRMMNQMQKQYDAETHHGSNQPAQNEWDAKIDAELKSYGVK